jgi:hypothetical protein
VEQTILLRVEIGMTKLTIEKLDTLTLCIMVLEPGIQKYFADVKIILTSGDSTAA